VLVAVVDVIAELGVALELVEEVEIVLVAFDLLVLLLAILEVVLAAELVEADMDEEETGPKYPSPHGNSDSRSSAT
jgi:hypothetical protein